MRCVAFLFGLISERLRQSRSATLEGQDEADNYLGVDGETFKLDMAPCRVVSE